jgi:hypothetical protein
MSTANLVDRVSVPALGAEGAKDVAVVTPDVVEVRLDQWREPVLMADDILHIGT